MSKEPLANSVERQRLQLINRYYSLNHFKIVFHLLYELDLYILISDTTESREKKLYQNKIIFEFWKEKEMY